MTPTNRTIVLASRPHGAPASDNFRMEERPVPIPGAGELLLQLCYLSLDPYMRGRMNDAPSYTPPFELDAPLTGGAVSRVIDPAMKASLSEISCSAISAGRSMRCPTAPG